MIIREISVILFVSAFVSLLLAVFSLTKKNISSYRYIIFLQLAIFIWCFFQGLELAVQSTEMKILMSKLSYFGVVSVSLLFLLFCMEYANIKRWVPFKFNWFLWIVPFIIVVLTLTNEFHFLIWSGFETTEYNFARYLIYYHGPLFWIIVGYSYLMLIIAFLILLKTSLKVDKINKIQVVILISAAFFPMLGNFLYIIRIYNPIYDLTPISFVISSILTFISIFGLGLLELSPIAKDELFKNLNDAVIILDTENQIRDINKAAARYFKYENVINHKFCDVFEDWEEICHFIEKNSYGSLELKVRKNGDKIWLKIFVNSVYNSFNQIRGRILVLNDITQLKTKEEELIQSESELKKLNASKDKFFGIIAHDLKSPFSGVIGLMDLLIRDMDKMEREELNEILYALKKSLDSIYKLLNNLLLWSRMQRGLTKFSPEVAYVDFFIRTCMSVFNDMAMAKKINIVVEEHFKTPVFVDPNMIDSVFRNLISNAIKFSNPDSKITISVSDYSSSYIIVTIKDSGIGMSEIMRSKLFSIEEKIIQPGTDGETGTGLGLILCKEFLQHHSCDIRVESSPEKGTSVSFTLPKYRVCDTKLNGQSL